MPAMPQEGDLRLRVATPVRGSHDVPEAGRPRWLVDAPAILGPVEGDGRGCRRPRALPSVGPRNLLDGLIDVLLDSSGKGGPSDHSTAAGGPRFIGGQRRARIGVAWLRWTRNATPSPSIRGSPRGGPQSRGLLGLARKGRRPCAGIPSPLAPESCHLGAPGAGSARIGPRESSRSREHGSA